MESFIAAIQSVRDLAGTLGIPSQFLLSPSDLFQAIALIRWF